MPEFVSDGQAKLQVSYKYASSSPTYLFELSLEASDSNDVNVLIEQDNMPNFAMEGDTFGLLRVHEAELLEKIILKCSVFARMTPDQKLHLIELLQNAGYQVGMCGDGANDYGALKAAHTGLSISMTEASLVAPFTSTQQNVQCISTLIREGRATLVSTFDASRFLVCYTFMFFVAAFMLYRDGQKLSYGAYEICVLMNLFPPFFIGGTGAYHALSKRQPARSVFSFIPSLSIFSFLFIQICILAMATKVCRIIIGYDILSSIIDTLVYSKASHTGTIILKMNMMSYITASVIFPSGKPYRNKFFSNMVTLMYTLSCLQCPKVLSKAVCDIA